MSSFQGAPKQSAYEIREGELSGDLGAKSSTFISSFNGNRKLHGDFR